MSVVPVRKVTLVAQAKDKERIMMALQDAGVLHISSLQSQESDQVREQETQVTSSALTEVSLSIDFLRKFLGSPTAIPEKVIHGASLLARVSHLRLDYEACKHSIEQLRHDINLFEPFGEFRVNPRTLEEDSIFIKLAKLDDDEVVLLEKQRIDFYAVNRVGQLNCVVLFCGPNTKLPCETFEPPNMSIAELKASLHKARLRLVKLDKEASILAYQLRILETLRESTLVKLDRLIELQKITNKEGLIGISGFILYKEIGVLRKALSDILVALSLEEPTHGQAVPVMLDNPKVIKGFESIVRAFSGVNYFEKDKTVLVSLLFMFFGALCLLDAGYGFLLLIGGYVVAIKKNRDFGQVFMWTGALSMILGILCGQVFGLVFAKDIMLNIPPILTLATDPMACFKFSLVVGVGAMGLTNVVAIYQNGLRTHALGCLFAIFCAITLMLKESAIFVMRFNDPSALLTNIAMGFAGLCVVLWVIFPEPVFGPQQKLANALWMLYSGPIGLVQDILSHMRLFGIALSGSILALVINKISSLLPVFLGTLFAPFGHFIVFLLSLLSLYIHSNRLIFLEFGSKCMSGGHNYFKPFARRIWS
jgi:V/A-type H+/Na+-transporting ATPase subunit I